MGIRVRDYFIHARIFSARINILGNSRRLMNTAFTHEYLFVNQPFASRLPILPHSGEKITQW